MKRHIIGLSQLLLVKFIILGLVILPACSLFSPASLPSIPSPPTPGKGNMTALIDGNVWTATSIPTFSYSNNTLSIIAKSSNPVITIALTVETGGPGTYSIGPQSPGTNTVITIGSSVWQADGFTGSGTITFKGMTPRGVLGTFSLTVTAVPNTPATGTKTITDGVFNITPSLPNGR